MSRICSQLNAYPQLSTLIRTQLFILRLSKPPPTSLSPFSHIPLVEYYINVISYIDTGNTLSKNKKNSHYFLLSKFSANEQFPLSQDFRLRINSLAGNYMEFPYFARNKFLILLC